MFITNNLYYYYFFFQASLLEQREKIQQKHDEAKFLKDGIDRRSRLVTNILRKYLSDEQFDEYDHFIRMKSTLLMDAKDIEENITFLQKQIQIFLNTSSISHFEHSSSTNVENLQTNYCKSISTTA
jgi:metal-responsive CopG/Arc/MetJ family transcriptional regulator